MNEGERWGERAGDSRRPTRPVRPPADPPEQYRCQRCNFPVPDRVAGCKNPCPNCGTVYPLGDCSD